MSSLSILILLSLTCSAVADNVLFTADGTFVVPNGVTNVNVLACGGGGGGANGHQGGGGAGYIVSALNVPVTPGTPLPVVVGVGGSGAETRLSDNTIVGLTAGGDSSFNGVVASGGEVVTGINQPGSILVIHTCALE